MSDDESREKRGRPSPKRDRFVQEYLVDLNATQAAIRCGYSARTANEQGSRLLADVRIRDAVAKAMAERSARTEVTADRVIRELAAVAFANMRRYTKVVDGAPVVAFEDLSDDDWRAVQSIESEVVLERAGDEFDRIRKTKFKLHDKLVALEKLGKHLGMWIERHEVEVRDLSRLSDDQLARIAAGEHPSLVVSPDVQTD